MNILRINVLTVALTVLMAATSQAQTWFTNGLVAYYPFNGNANDAVGTNHGTIFKALLAPDRFGNAGKAYTFNGADAAISFPYSPVLNPPSVTVGGWFYLNAAPTTLDNMCVFNYTYVFQGWILRIDTSTVMAFGVHKLPGTSIHAIATNSMQLNRWMHLLGTYDGQRVAFYLNGKMMASTNYAGGYDASPNGMKIGLNLNGVCDDIRIYNRALSAKEVASLYYYESQKQVQLIKYYNLDFDGLLLGRNYQLQASTNLLVWTNWGTSFTATSDTYTNTIPYQRVEDWSKVFFRLQQQ